MEKSEALFLQESYLKLKQYIKEYNDELAELLLDTLLCHVAKILVEIRDKEYYSNGKE